MTEDEVFSTQMTHHRFILSTIYFWKGFNLGSIPPALSIHLSAQAITSISLSLPVPFIDPLYCCWDLCFALPAATEPSTETFYQETRACTKHVTLLRV